MAKKKLMISIILEIYYEQNQFIFSSKEKKHLILIRYCSILGTSETEEKEHSHSEFLNTKEMYYYSFKMA